MIRWPWESTRAPRVLTLGAAVALLTLTLAACGGGSDNGTANSAPATTAASGAGTGDLEAVEATVLFQDNVFEPESFTFKAGTKVTFNYENPGLAVHNMIVQSQDVEGKNFQSPVAVNPGEQGSFEATFTKPGTYKFICVYHQPGMEGTITVE